MLALSGAGGRVVERVPAGHIYVDGLRTWDMKSVVLRDRRTLSRDGFVVVVLTVDKATGKVLKPPEVVSSGFIDITESPGLLEQASEAVLRAVNHGDGTGQPPEWGYITTKVKDELGNFLHRETGTPTDDYPGAGGSVGGGRC